MAWIAALIAGGAALVGDMTSSSNTQSTNDTSMSIANTNNYFNEARQQEAEAFNSEQAGIARAFNAQQVGQMEDFQRSQQAESERFNNEESSTAMTRRAQDLRAAGINPLLAIGAGGASTPTVAPMSGGAATSPSASTGISSSAGLPMLRSPGDAWGNLGGQVASAFSLYKQNSEIDLLKAQADKTRAEADVKLPAEVQNLKSLANLNDVNAQQVYYKTQEIQEDIYNQRLNNDRLRDIIMPQGKVDLVTAKAVQDALISASHSDAAAKALGLSRLRNLNAIESSQVGYALDWLDRVTKSANSAIDVVKPLSSGLPNAGNTDPYIQSGTNRANLETGSLGQ